MNNIYFEKPFEDDEKNSNDDSSVNDVEYKFEGYKIELNEKIMLTPVKTPEKGKTNG